MPLFLHEFIAFCANEQVLDRETASQAWYSEAVEACVDWSRSNMILLHVLLYVSLPFVVLLTQHIVLTGRAVRRLPHPNNHQL